MLGSYSAYAERSELTDVQWSTADHDAERAWPNCGDLIHSSVLWLCFADSDRLLARMNEMKMNEMKWNENEKWMKSAMI